MGALVTYGQEGDICDFCGTHCAEPQLPPSRTTLEILEEDLRQLRYHSGIDQYPYPEGIEGLRTTLICALNTMLNMLPLLRRD